MCLLALLIMTGQESLTAVSRLCDARGPDRYCLLSIHIEFSQIFKTLQIQIEFGALKLFRNSKSHNSE